MTITHEKPAVAHRRTTARINLNAKAWRRLRKIYADQPISLVRDWQNRFAGRWLSVLESIAYKLSKAPGELPELIFVIGHWRSGTTFLHEMLCRNPAFNFPTTYACMNPQVFPITEAAVLERSGQRSVARPMDSMLVALASPQEDEFALLALGAASPYEGLLFPKSASKSMAAADPESRPAPELQEWINVFLRFVSQVAARKPGCPVVLKSPTHSYRVKLLSRLFPHARFIHIVRNPIEVYSSTVNMWQKLGSLYALTELPDDDALAAQVIANSISLEEKLDAALPGVREENYLQVRYETLSAHPLAEMEKIYDKLRLGAFSMASPHIESYLATRPSVTKDRFDLDRDTATRVFQAWRHIFEKYGYPAPSALL